ncbi:DUF2812 domain-containing protein [Paenibacillus sp. 19GGS1-52]|uniref:DUF2812 domain-containing protein n=1 Tax=Paenibacillus sp. 19GGS1-52 TaxID=2758563 RepID=UPI001EFA41E2|nr:DUF2812 domain-containing protein [Paenibacillus sp. 19GGS1-52]ULO05957.1 DUF2812 domain-containing protein [Paenibacillus sp. 19GGS1-52]
MSRTVRKLFMDFEKEEQWLNEMAAKGLALIKYSWACYVFEESGRGEFIYRLELLENDPKGAKSAEYLKFVEETGAECVAVNFRWVIFRKKAADGPFTIYSDADSIIKHYQRVHRLWISLAMMELVIGFINLGMSVLNNRSSLSNINLVIGLLLIALGAVFILFSMRVRKKIKKLSSDKLIRD